MSKANITTSSEDDDWYKEITKQGVLQFSRDHSNRMNIYYKWGLLGC